MDAYVRCTHMSNTRARKAPCCERQAGVCTHLRLGDSGKGGACCSRHHARRTHEARRMPSAACQHSGRMRHCCKIGIRGAWPLDSRMLPPHAHSTRACYHRMRSAAFYHTLSWPVSRCMRAACVLLFVHLGAYARVCNF